MVKYKQTSITSKEGVNFVRSVVEKGGSLFHKVEHENDLGIDGVIEFIRAEQPLHKMVAVQIKSGPSFYVPNNGECKIPIENHREYWTKYRLPVVGLVYVPALECAYWVNVKDYLERNAAARTISFAANRTNQFNNTRFKSVFLPSAVGETAVLPLEEAISLLKSQDKEERLLPLHVAFRRFPNEKEAWNAIVNLFISKTRNELPSVIVHYFAHIPWHGDIFGFGEQITEETRDYVKTLFNKFGRAEVLRLLEFVDSETFISRGSIGQSVEAVVSSLDTGITTCEEIAKGNSIPLFPRECAGMIFAMHRKRDALPVLELLVKRGSLYAEQMIEAIRECGGIYPYQ
jgi:Domain of unknown function (DUF4365)